MPSSVLRAAMLAGFVLIVVSSTRADEAVQRKVTEADMPRIPHTEPGNVLSTFRLAKGFQLELVASEPMVSDPVDACFDEFGRMFVAEMHGYPFSQEPTQLNPNGGGKVNAGIIRMLEDTDDDGVMDRSVVFADGISWPTSVCCYNGGIFVIAPMYLYYFKDTTGDGRADVREVILSGFGRGNVQAVTNGLQWGIDNHIYFAAGRNPTDLQHRDQKLFPVSGADLRFNPKTEVFEEVTGGLQFGHALDDWGTRFVCSNSDHIQQVLYPRGYLSRNPWFVAPNPVRSIASDGASAKVFRLSPPEPWRIVRQKWRAAEKGYELIINKDGGWEFIPMDPSKKAGVVPTEYPVGYFTSATGITIYRGDAYPDEYRGNAFVGDVGGNLVHRKTVSTGNVTYIAQRADEGEELLASSDNWFRPVNFVNAPDGCLYILDMYRETIEHPFSIPEEIKAFLDLTSGHDRGRIYRLLSPDAKRRTPKKLGAMSVEDLVMELNSSNGWNRDTAQRLLWERQEMSAVPLIEQLLTSSRNPAGRLHAMWTLQGLGAISPLHVKTRLEDDHARVRAHAAQLSEPFLREDANVLSWLAPLIDDPSEHVRSQLAFTLGESSDERAADLLARLLSDERIGTDVRVAVYSSAGVFADRIVSQLMLAPEALSKKHVAIAVSDLGLIIGANPDSAQSIRLMQAMTAQPASVQRLVLTELGKGLARRGVTIESLLTTDSASSLRTHISQIFSAAAATAVDVGADLTDRLAAVKLLAYSAPATALRCLPELLSSSTPQELQKAAVEALGMQNSDEVTDVLLSGWRSYSPSVRSEVVLALTSKASRVLALLSAVENGDMKRGDIERIVKQQLMSHRDSAIKTRSVKLFGSDVSTNRSKVVDDHQDVLQLTADAVRGRQVFTKTCSVCHRVDDIGFKVAPDLVSVKNKSEADLLIAILDPNREAQPNFNVYTVVTRQGRTHNGIIASESSNSVTLRRAEAKEDVLLRSNIEELSSTDISLMPEGLEKDLSHQQIADVIAFVKSIGQPEQQ